MRRLARSSLIAAVFFLVLPAIVALFRDTYYQGQDFRVFWQAGHALVKGERLYDFARDGAMVFKYPPWIALVFYPFGWFSLATSKVIWALIQLYCLGYSSYWAYCRRVSLSILLLTFGLFWGIWAVHFMDGQVTLPLLTLLLFSFNRGKPVMALWASTVKVFSAFALLGTEGWTWRKVGLGVLLLVAMTGAVAGLSPDQDFLILGRQWLEAAGSGGDFFSDKVRGRDNQGLPAFVLRVLSVPASNTRADLYAFIGVAFAVGLVWKLLSRRMAAPMRWAGWIALTAVVHPLAWFHTFVLAFPMCTLLLQEAKTRKRFLLWGISLIAVGMICVMTRKTLGTLGEQVELLSIKSWGVLLGLAVLVYLNRQDPKL